MDLATKRDLRAGVQFGAGLYFATEAARCFVRGARLAREPLTAAAAAVTEPAPDDGGGGDGGATQPVE